jgi:hypothetical protein
MGDFSFVETILLLDFMLLLLLLLLQMKVHFFLFLLFLLSSPSDLALQGGAIREVLRTVNFGIYTDVDSVFNKLRQYQPTGPLMCTEFW